MQKSLNFESEWFEGEGITLRELIRRTRKTKSTLNSALKAFAKSEGYVLLRKEVGKRPLSQIWFCWGEAFELYSLPRWMQDHPETEYKLLIRDTAWETYQTGANMLRGTKRKDLEREYLEWKRNFDIHKFQCPRQLARIKQIKKHLDLC